MSAAETIASSSFDLESALDTGSENGVLSAKEEDDLETISRKITRRRTITLQRKNKGIVHHGGSTYDVSLFEYVITTRPPILESLLSQLPTVSLLDLFHTSRYLREFLANYPLAWKTLSFRLPQPAPAIGSPGNETPDGNRERQSKQYALDGLLIQIVVPFGTRLRNLDLCNTAVSGVALVARVLQPRVSTIQHLSVRGCKNVSIKYHLVPFLEPYSKKGAPWATRNQLRLKSLYAYRCRHHRRRPYLPSSLIRKDSDSEPTHQLIEICHELDIWTDTAWCPTPAGRCFRRKDYHNGRAAPGTPEVWVPFDRLWRSCNRLGPSQDAPRRGGSDGRLWEDAETGHDGEPLGPEEGSARGEGKDVPAHLRKSHTTFIEDVKCSQCGDDILERCEQCSVRMHCMGCRKTLCASCAFNRPVPRKRAKTRHFTQMAFGNAPAIISSSNDHMFLSADDSSRPSSPVNDRFWWAPGAIRSPNLMQESLSDDDDGSDSDDGGNNVNANNVNAVASASPLKLNMNWCCLEPIFSGGGGITFLGNAIGGQGADKIRAAPLPRMKQYEDPEFSSFPKNADKIRNLKSSGIYDYVLGEDIDIMTHLTQDSLMLQASTCPRSLCQDCYRTFRWKVSCRGCKKPLCKEHDFRALKVRKCGFRDLQTERDFILNYRADRTELEIPAFKGSTSIPQSSESASTSTPYLPSQHTATGPQIDSLLSPPPPPPLHAHSPTDLPTPVAEMSSSISSRGLALTESENYNGASASRPRSLSVSDLRNRASNISWQNQSRTGPHARVPRPGHPRHPVQWEGCGAYFCQYPRAIGDSRPRCLAGVKECKECGVYVCDVCITTSPSCSCGYCIVNYHCPHCLERPSVRKNCRYQEEYEARAQAAEEERKKKEQERETVKAADELAEQLGEFFSGLFNDGSTEQTWSADLTMISGPLINEDGEIVEDDGNAATVFTSEDQLQAQADELQLELDAALNAVAALDPDHDLGMGLTDHDFDAMMAEAILVEVYEESSDHDI